ncbi:MAG: isopenicillin N synthase family oxygenase [Alphaproteobacteria bacterium]|nr:isopenicillin N synthase family oxygenase [Alphaproteobacteria bacterium]HPF47129.1 2-oxoglutarate and iron-dependent oxygenase domain-containing protein [Emcibacteraceae bacterium]HRW31073.1 2-oxoglutarate and iron-dependent oxygenase domain-containing protein [Emcibacteraceae bacterium]
MFANKKSVEGAAIPVIDIKPLRDGTDPQSVAAALHAASRDYGFIYIKNHGIPDNSIFKARETAYSFFHSDETLKSTIKISDKHRGWINSGGAKMDDKLKPDFKESFLWGYEDENGITPEDHPLRGRNQWPDFLPELRNSAMDYFSQAHMVAHQLMQGFALGLGLDKEFFLKTSDLPLSRGSFVYYPDQPREMGNDQFGVGPHTDFGVLTVLCQDDVGGLEVQNIKGDWIEAPPIDGTLIVNVGDLLHRWTNGQYKSTPHRVINRSGRERLSLVLAFDPNPETIIDAAEIFGNANEPAISCGEYLTWRFDRAFAYRKKHDG